MGNAMDRWMADNPDVTVVDDSSEDVDDQVNHNDPDEGESSWSSDSDDDDGESTRPNSSVPNNLSGGGGSDNDGGDSTPEPTQEQEQLLDGSAGGTSGGGSDDSSDSSSSSSGSTRPNSSVPNNLSGGGGASDDSGDSTPEPTQTQDQMLDGSTGSRPSRQSGSGIGPSGVEGSEAATPESETDAPQNDSTQNIDATRTDRLESDVTANDVVREQAQSLEDQVAGQKVTDVVDGLNTTGAELREEDIEVTRSGDTLEATLSPVGEERIQNIASRQADEQAERAVEEQLNTSFTNADVSVDNSGNVGVSEDVQNEATEQGIAGANPGVQESDITFEDGEPQVQQSEQSDPSDPADRVAQELGLNQGEDFTITREAGNVSVNLTSRGAQELRGRNEQAEGDALTGFVEDFESVTGFDLPGNTSEAGEAREQRANTESGELFGGRGDFEQQLRGAAQDFDETITTPASNLAGDIAGFGSGESNPLSQYTTEEQQADLESSGMSRTEAEGTTEGAVGLFNLPAIGTTAIEAGEVVNQGLESTAVAGGTEEDFEEFESNVAEGAALQGVNLAEAAQSNPDQFRSQLVGGTIGATGALRAGRTVGGARGSQAVGSLVQPGEEVLKALRRAPDSSTARSFFDDESGQLFKGTGESGSSDGTITLDEDTLQQLEPDPPADLDMRTDLTDREVATRDSGRTEEGGMSDSDRYQAGRGQTLMERRQQRRQQERQLPDEDLRDVDAEDRIPEQDLREQAETPQARVEEQLFGEQTRLDTAAGVGGATTGLGLAQEAQQQQVTQSVESEAGQGLGQELDAGQSLDFGTGFDVDFETGLEGRTELDNRTETRTEIGTEARTATETRTAFEQAFETRTETRTETQTESRTELRTELGFETRRETELPDSGGSGDDEELFGGFGADDDTFGTGIASGTEASDPFSGGSDTRESLFGDGSDSVF